MDIQVNDIINDPDCIYQIPEEKRIVFVQNAIEHCPEIIYKLPKEFQTEELIIIAIELNPKVIKHISPEKLTDPIYRSVIDDVEGVLEYIPEERKTEWMCMSAVGNDPFMLCYTPEKFKSYELCMMAFNKITSEYDDMEQYYELIREIPVQDICVLFLDAYTNKVEVFEILDCIYPTIMNRDIALEALALDPTCRHPYLLSYITSKERRIIESLDQYDEYNFKRLPIESKTELVSYAAVKYNPRLYPFIPKTSVTERVIFALLSRDPDYLPNINALEVSRKMFQLAFKATSDPVKLFKQLPFEFQTMEFCKIAIETDKRIFNFVPDPIKRIIISENISSTVHEHPEEADAEKSITKKRC